ncbi:hypothetical protein NUW58_g8728 [Xylaria curta]|uniref:Uncharacterized protein n=1 Tax=Xylaria curta TaxID=42375 RepID=A0ACC1N4L0_9PEZI|nr:hypothetical protein NUW58_g8728 [Xylaria curta]
MRFLFHSSRLARTSRASRPVSHHAFSTTTPTTRAYRRGPPLSVLAPASRSATLRALSQTERRREHQTQLTPKQKRDAINTYLVFQKLAFACLDDFLKDNRWRENEKEYKAFGVTSKLDFNREAKLFRKSIAKACQLASERDAVSRKENPLFWSIRNAFVTQDIDGLSAEIKHAFRNCRHAIPVRMVSCHPSPPAYCPPPRRPTNSGKTYNALKALENAKTGIYAGPLRLLAHEVYSRFMAKGKSCALITGEEQRIPQGVDVYFKSCTVEMTPLNSLVDVAVIDEIQMIGDGERGWAWTQAFLGVQAKEVHLCGEERAVELIQSLCATLGDKCIVSRYKRLSGLETMHESLGGKLENLQKGDAVVSFTRVGIHSLKTQIERVTDKRCAIVYGSLPPETRAQQAALFNDPNNDYDYLVASDAIGMGLNLEIKRVVFEATSKRDSTGFRQMSVSELKQIGGRAGRYRTANHAIQTAASGGKPLKPKPRGPGLVTAFEDDDLAIVIDAFNSEPKPIKTAGLQPPAPAIERLSTYFPPNTPLSFILSRLCDIARISSRFHLCHLKEMLEIADLIQPFPMTIYDRCIFLNAPVALRDHNGAVVLQAFAKCVSRMEGGKLVDIPEIELELLDIKQEEWKDGPANYLRRLEALHKSLTLYLWLSYRFSGVFESQHLAFHAKGLVEVKINDYLSGIKTSEARRRARAEAIRKSRQAQRLEQQQLEEISPGDAPMDEAVGEWNEEGRKEPLYDDSTQIDQITRLEPRSDKRHARR